MTFDVAIGKINGAKIMCDGKVLEERQFKLENLTPVSSGRVYFSLSVNNVSSTISFCDYTTKDVYFTFTRDEVTSTSIRLKSQVGFDSGVKLEKTYWTTYGDDPTLYVTGLEPNTNYTFELNAKVRFGTNFSKFRTSCGKYSVTTNVLTFATLPGQAMNKTTALLCAETNISENEENVGFEWRRYDAPETMPSSKVTCAVVDGKLMGALTGLNPDAYYNYRPYYTSAKGNSYYGEWITFFTGDSGVYFDPTVRTYEAAMVGQTSAVLKGYALRGSADIARQGFQLWNAWGSTRANDDIKEITVSGQKLSHSISDLQPATTYAYRTFVETADGKTIYGDEMQFTTEAVTAIEDAVEDRQEATIVGYYTLQGHPISALQKGVNIIRYSDGSARKVLMR